MDKILTIIIPAYNMEKYLDRCLASLIVDSARLQVFEALVINDGSIDKTSEIAHSYEVAYPDTFRVIDKENGHYGSCVNRGLKEAKGTFIKVLDADDAFDTQIFTSFLSYLETNDVLSRADVIISDYSFVDCNGKPLKTILYSRHNHAFSKKELTPEDKMEWFIHGLTYRTALLRDQKYQQTEGVSYTDNEWSFVPMAYASVLFSFSKSLYRYSTGIDNQSISPSVHAKNLWMEIAVIKRIIVFYSSLSNNRKDAFLQDRLIILTEHLYQLCLLTMRRNVALDLLKDLDNCLKINCPEEYSLTNQYSITIAGLKFHPIRNWRENRRCMVIFQSLLYDLADWYNGLKHSR